MRVKLRDISARPISPIIDGYDDYPGTYQAGPSGACSTLALLSVHRGNKHEHQHSGNCSQDNSWCDHTFSPYNRFVVRDSFGYLSSWRVQNGPEASPPNRPWWSSQSLSYGSVSQSSSLKSDHHTIAVRESVKVLQRVVLALAWKAVHVAWYRILGQ